MVKTNFVGGVKQTLLGTQDPRQVLESVSQEQPRTFLEIVRHCVASPVFNCCLHRSNHFATTCFFLKKKLLETPFDCAPGPCLHLETSRRQDGFDSANDFFRKS